MSSMEVNIDMLEQMDLMDVSDQEALDVFLNSSGEDNAMPSPVLGRRQTCISIISPQREDIRIIMYRSLKLPVNSLFYSPVSTCPSPVSQ